MISINFYGAPSAGKSTAAAYTFSFFKNKGINIEHVTEYAKQMIYSKRQDEMTNQIYMLAKQYKKMKDIAEYQKVPIIVTDSPLLLSLVYSKNLHYYDELKSLTNKLNDEFHNINIYVKRIKPYNLSGRNQTEMESDNLASEISTLTNMDYIIDGDEYGQKNICEILSNLELMQFLY